jgi:periplasmic protein TonB
MKRLFFALMFAISVHAALFFIKIDIYPKSEILSKPEPIKITMSYRPRPIKKEIKKLQPETVKSSVKKKDTQKVKKQILTKKPSPAPPAKKKLEPVKKKHSKPAKKKSLVKTIKKPIKKIEPKLNSKIVFKEYQTSKGLPLEQNKIIIPKQESKSVAAKTIDKIIEKNIEKKNKSTPRKEEPATVVIHTIATPKYKINPKLTYPRIAKKRGYQGKVVLSVVVSKTGTAQKVSISKSSGHKMLDKAASKAVSQWQFYPGTRDGKFVEMSVEVPIRFDLK